VGYTKDEVELFELITRILCDYTPDIGIDAVCIFGETVENERSMLEEAAGIFHSGIARSVAITGFEGTHSGNLNCSSGEELKNKLIDEFLVADGLIRLFPLSKKLPPCTDAEAIGLVEYATKQGLESLVLTLPPLHQVRGMISLISAVLKAGSSLKVYSIPALAPLWTENVMHSQSAPRAPRHAQFGGELAKLIRYMEKGNHMSPREILDYLNQRDNV